MPWSAVWCGRNSGWRCGWRSSWCAYGLAILLSGSLFPELAAMSLFGIRLNWLVLALAVYPCCTASVGCTCGWPSRVSATSSAWSTRNHDRPCRPDRRRTARRPRWPPSQIGVYGGRFSRTTSDFLVASRSVGPRWNAAAISGEYLSAASFLGVAWLGRQVRRRRAVVPRRLHGRLSRAAAVRRGPAAPVRRVHRARLHRVPLGLGPAAHGRRCSFVVVICVLYLVPQYQGAGLTLNILLGRAFLDRTGGGGGDHHRQRGRRRDAVHHVRAGVPILVEADRDRDPCPRLAGAVPHRPAPAGRAAAADGRPADHGHGRNRPVVVQVDAPAGITLTGTLDGRLVRDAPIGSTGEHSLGTGTTLTLAAGARHAGGGGRAQHGRGVDWFRRRPGRCASAVSGAVHHRRNVPRHDGASACAGAVLHQPGWAGGAAHRAGGDRAAGGVLRIPRR